MDARLEGLAQGRLGVFTAQEALTAGYDVDGIKAELRRKRWIRLRKGVYACAEAAARADPRTRHLMSCVAVLLVLADGPVLSHASASRLHGLLVPASAGPDVRVTTVGQWRVGRGYRVAQAALPDADVLPWSAYQVTSVPRTLVDCAREWSQTDAVIALDAALHRQVVTRAELRSAVLSARHRAGASAAARAVDLSDGRAESPLETRGRLRLLASGLPLPELQVDLFDERGFVGRLDAWYEDAAVAVEFDGFEKYADPWGDRSPAQVAWQEKRRQDRVLSSDIRVVRVVNEDLGTPWGDLATRLRALLARPCSGPRRFRIVRRPEPGATEDAA